MSDNHKRIRAGIPEPPKGMGRAGYNTRVLQAVAIEWKRLSPEEKEPYKTRARQDNLKRAKLAMNLV